MATGGAGRSHGGAVARHEDDILARVGDAFRYDDLEAETLTVEGVSVRVATPRMLHRMKRDTVRPQDRRRGRAAGTLPTGEGLMPLRKYRSVEEMPGAGFRTPLDPDNLRMAFELSAMAERREGARVSRERPAWRAPAEGDERAWCEAGALKPGPARRVRDGVGYRAARRAATERRE